MTLEGRRRATRLLRGVVSVALLAAVLAAIAVAPAVAIEAETFRVVPSPLEVQGHERRTFSFALDPGDTATDAIRITNTTDETRRYQLYGADARTNADNAVSVDDGSTEPTGVGGWIELPVEEIELEPGASQVVEFRVRRPAGTTAEGIGAIAVEEVPGRDDDGGIDVVYRLAILIRLDGDVAGVHVARPAMRPPVELFPSRSKVAVTLTNETLQPVTASVEFTAGGVTGRYWELGAREVRLAAGESRDVSAAWTTVPRWGGYFQPAASVAWEGGSIVRNGPRSLHPPLWLLALAILLVGVRGLRELRPGPAASEDAAAEAAGSEQGEPAAIRSEGR